MNPLIHETRVRAKPHKVAEPNPLVAPSKQRNLIGKSKQRNLIAKPEEFEEPSTLQAIGNTLELPKSSVVDALAGENPLDQWATPTRSINRTTGKELLQKHNMVDEDSWVPGLALDVALDPLTYTGFGVATKGGKALSKAGLLKGTNAASRLDDATRTTVREVLGASEDPSAAMKAFEQAGGKAEHFEQPIKHVIDFAGVDVGKGLAPVVDKAKDKLLEVPGMRHLRAAFSPSVLNSVTRAGQDIAEVRKTTMDEAMADLGYRFAEPVRTGDTAVAKSLLDDVAKQAEASGLEMNRFKDYIDASDASKALENSQHLTRASSMAHASHELLGTSAKADGTGVPIIDALKRLGLDTEASRKAVADWAGGRPIESLSIDKSLLDDAGRFVKPYTDPEVVGGVRKAVESFNRLLKTHTTLPFPQWHTRNLLSGQVMNVAMGASDLKHLPKDLVSVARLKTGKTVRGLAKDIPDYKAMGISDAEATRLLESEMFAHGVTSTMTAADTGKSASRLAGANKLVEAAKGPKPIAPTPMEIAGKIAGGVEDFNRITPYLNLRRSGYSPEIAAARVKELQVDYSDNLTGFEKRWGKLAIPFYTFSSRMLPLVARELAQHPGGPTAQMVRVGSKSDASSDKPEWMKGETSIPVGGTHISGLGLMHEGDATKLIGSALKGDLPELARQGAMRLNPLIKFPIEQATQHDLRTGKALDSIHDVEDVTGQPIQAAGPIGTLAEHAVRSSPVARYVSEAKKLQQGRDKALKSLLGVKSSD